MPSLPLGHNAVPPKAEQELLKVFRSGRYSPGRKVKQFEEEWARLHKARHAIFVNSGTDALRLSLLAMKEKYQWADGDKVAVPALTFVATVNVVIQAHLTPVFVDVDPGTYGMADRALMDVIHRQDLVAAVPVHLFGMAVNNNVFVDLKRVGVKVLEDSCETVLNAPVGDVSCHSTYMAHHVTTGVGGMAVTNDDKLNLMIRSLANHGRDPAYLPGYSQIPMSRALLARRFRFNRIGYSCRATEFEAVLGLSQMGGLRENVHRRQVVFRKLITALDSMTDDFSLPSYSYGDANTCMMFPIVIKETSKLRKYDVCLHLEKHGIETRDMMPVTSQPCYRTYFDDRRFAVADRINRTGFYIGINPEMTERDVEWIRKIFIGLDKRAQVA